MTEKATPAADSTRAVLRAVSAAAAQRIVSGFAVPEASSIVRFHHVCRYHRHDNRRHQTSRPDLFAPSTCWPKLCQPAEEAPPRDGSHHAPELAHRCQSPKKKKNAWMMSMLVAYEAMDINNENLHCFFLVFLDSWLQPGNPSTRSSPGGGTATRSLGPGMATGSSPRSRATRLLYARRCA